MKISQTVKKNSRANGFRIASFVFLGLGAVLLLVASVLRFFSLEGGGVNNVSDSVLAINGVNVKTLIALFTYYGFVFVVVYAWLYTLYLFFYKGSASHKPMFVAGNAMVFVGLILVMFIWLVQNFPAFNIFDLFYAYATGLISSYDLQHTLRYFLIINTLVFAILVCGFGMLIFAMIDPKIRDRQLFVSSVVVFIIASILSLSSVVLFLADGKDWSVSFLPRVGAVHMLSLNTVEDTYSLFAAIGFVLMLTSIVLLLASGTKSLTVDGKALTISAALFAVMANCAIVFAILFCSYDYDTIITPSEGLSLDSAYYASYGLFLALAIIGAAFIFMSFGRTFNTPVRRALARIHF